MLTVFSGGAGFAQAAMQHTTGDAWVPIGGDEDKPDRVALWDAEAQERYGQDAGHILGDYDAVCAKLEQGQLLTPDGVIDCVVATPPCQDYATVNPDAGGATGPTGRFFADLPRFLTLLKKRHHVKSVVLEEVVGVLATAEFGRLLECLRQTAHQVCYGEAQFWFAGVASTRARVILVAILVAELKQPGPFGVPGLVAQGDSSEQQRLRQSVPTLRHVLLDPEEVDPALREPLADMAAVMPSHIQTAMPAIQVGRMRGAGTNRFVYSVDAPALTMRANIYKAEGVGGVTGLYLDALGPRRLAPIEVLRLHGFPPRWVNLPVPTVYHIVGNSVPVQYAAELLNAVNELLK